MSVGLEHTARLIRGEILDREKALALAEFGDTPQLMSAAAGVRDHYFGQVMTYSKKCFIPLTQLCRDVCYYCTFAKSPKRVEKAYMEPDEVVAQVKAAADVGCKEALLTLGEKPEWRFKEAADALAGMGFASTLQYVSHVAGRILKETGVLPHINAGCMIDEEVAMLRSVSASMGLMLESSSERLCQPGMPHFGSPDKHPAVRLETIAAAGRARVPMTTGILIGIGETRRERIESLLAIRSLHQQYGHIQEVIVQNFRAKPDTKMKNASELSLDELLWSIAVARLVLSPDISLQAPPNLSDTEDLVRLVEAGINDWGGVSPVTPDFVNPEAPWPHLDRLEKLTAEAGKFLDERLTVYPKFIKDPKHWLNPTVHSAVMRLQDSGGFGRSDKWQTGQPIELPTTVAKSVVVGDPLLPTSRRIHAILEGAESGKRLSEEDICELFSARGADFTAVCRFADQLREKAVGDDVTFVVNRNINYTNICYFKCKFCAFSKGKLSENLRGMPYDLNHKEIAQRVDEAWRRGATEVCMQGGIHPEYTGQTYIDILRVVKGASPDIHVHAFSPLEVWQGAATLDISLYDFLSMLRDAGLGSLPGTAAEVLDDEVRANLCPDKINSLQWLEVMEAAHEVGLKSTATIMFGHIDNYRSWAKHLLSIRDLQEKTGGFTEFVPLPFVCHQSPIYLRGMSRAGPTFRESVLMHAVARIVFYPLVKNIQTSWVKVGPDGAAICLQAGANDLGGTLMNESITRSAGASHGQEMSVARLEAIARSVNRNPVQRTTFYGLVSQERQSAARNLVQLADLSMSLTEYCH